MRARLRQRAGAAKARHKQKASVLHARVHGEVKDMQQATDAECIYDARGRHQIVCEIFHPSLLLLLLLLMMLMMLLLVAKQFRSFLFLY